MFQYEAKRHGVRLSDTTKREIERQLALIKEDGTASVGALASLGEILPSSLKEAIRNAIFGRNYCIVENLPEAYPRKNILLFSMLIGKPVSYERDACADRGLVIDIKPRREHDGGSPSFRTSTEFDFHTDLSYMDQPPDYLSLYCIRQDPGKTAYNKLVQLGAVIEGAPHWVIRELEKPQYVFQAPPHVEGEPYTLNEMPVISRTKDGGYTMRIRRDKMRSPCERSARAVEHLFQAMERLSFRITLEPSSMVILSNLKLAHARSAFLPTYDERDRHLIKLFSVNGTEPH